MLHSTPKLLSTLEFSFIDNTINLSRIIDHLCRCDIDTDIMFDNDNIPIAIVIDHRIHSSDYHMYIYVHSHPNGHKVGQRFEHLLIVQNNNSGIFYVFRLHLFVQHIANSFI